MVNDDFGVVSRRAAHRAVRHNDIATRTDGSAEHSAEKFAKIFDSADDLLVGEGAGVFKDFHFHFLFLFLRRRRRAFDLPQELPKSSPMKTKKFTTAPSFFD